MSTKGLDDPLVSLSLTHVQYDPSDPYSYASAWLALLPQALLIVYVTLIWATREAEIILMLIGQLGCEALNALLKRSIRQERPRNSHGKGYGMPSSHAQFMFFWAVYLLFFILLRFKKQPDRKIHQRLNTGTSISHFVTAIVGVGLAAATALSRTYLSYHSTQQVAVGAGVGTCCALGWFVVVGIFRAGKYLDWILGTRLCRHLKIRDNVVHEEIWESGWRVWLYRLESRRSGKIE